MVELKERILNSKALCWVLYRIGFVFIKTVAILTRNKYTFEEYNKWGKEMRQKEDIIRCPKCDSDFVNSVEAMEESFRCDKCGKIFYLKETEYYKINQTKNEEQCRDV